MCLYSRHNIRFPEPISQTFADYIKSAHSHFLPIQNYIYFHIVPYWTEIEYTKRCYLLTFKLSTFSLDLVTNVINGNSGTGIWWQCDLFENNNSWIAIVQNVIHCYFVIVSQNKLCHLFMKQNLNMRRQNFPTHFQKCVIYENPNRRIIISPVNKLDSNYFPLSMGEFPI